MNALLRTLASVKLAVGLLLLMLAALAPGTIVEVKWMAGVALVELACVAGCWFGHRSGEAAPAAAAA